MTTFKTAKDYLSALGPEKIALAYKVAEASFSQEGDIAAALVLTQQARMAGHQVEISGPTLGRFRSSIGLVGRKAAPRTEEHAQAELPHVKEDGPERAGWAMVKQQQRTNQLLEEVSAALGKLLAAGLHVRTVQERLEAADSLGEPS